ncbi:sodium channel protein type 4 subunit alpha-like protein [Anopheles sinensis]|uniref:Sodium channel protein type 4 subunit alpha-like protein n=1 Tax=Anopheles sinensis TaxID=74873 RepID=A0A084VQ26_ANOSI|nr:sodium channel protein type 4 subunit alpha-like protein [Anopheles sinensis]
MEETKVRVPLFAWLVTSTESALGRLPGSLPSDVGSPFNSPRHNIRETRTNPPLMLVANAAGMRRQQISQINFTGGKAPALAEDFSSEAHRSTSCVTRGVWKLFGRGSL